VEEQPGKGSCQLFTTRINSEYSVYLYLLSSQKFENTVFNGVSDLDLFDRGLGPA